MLFFSTLVVRSSSRNAKIHSEDSSCASNFSISLRSCASITSANLRPTYNIWSSLSIFHSIKSENKSIFALLSTLFDEVENSYKNPKQCVGKITVRAKRENGEIVYLG